MDLFWFGRRPCVADIRLSWCLMNNMGRTINQADWTLNTDWHITWPDLWKNPRDLLKVCVKFVVRGDDWLRRWKSSYIFYPIRRETGMDDVHLLYFFPSPCGMERFIILGGRFFQMNLVCRYLYWYWNFFLHVS